MISLNKLFFWIVPLMLNMGAVLHAQVVMSTENGFWADSLTWSTASIPQEGDTVLLHHEILVGDSLTLPTSMRLIISSAGSLCSSDPLKLGSGVHLMNRGSVYFSALELLGGSRFENRGQVSVSGSMKVGATAYYLNEGYTQVGLEHSPCFDERAKELEQQVFEEPKDTPGQSDSLHSGMQDSAAKPIQWEELRLFPNPGKTQTSIRLPQGLVARQLVELLVLDLHGREILSLPSLSQTQEIEIRNWSKGIYLFFFQTQGQLHTEKFIKE